MDERKNKKDTKRKNAHGSEEPKMSKKSETNKEVSKSSKKIDELKKNKVR